MGGLGMREGVQVGGQFPSGCPGEGWRWSVPLRMAKERVQVCGQFCPEKGCRVQVCGPFPSG